jgi:hypothetical protein
MFHNPVTLPGISLIHHQGIIFPRDGISHSSSRVDFARSSLRRINPYASVVAPRRLASNTLLVIRVLLQPLAFTHAKGSLWWI